MTPGLSRRTVLFAGLPFLIGFGSVQRFLAPNAAPWPFWEAHDPHSRRTVDHSTWGSFLDTHLRRSADGVNMIAYGEVSDADTGMLDLYLRRLVDTPVRRLNRNEQLAYWFNLYNALTVRLILREYPVSSIRDINLGGGGVAGGPWAAKIVTVEGQRLSLNDIEHRIIRPIWQDPRIHYAVNCAAIGCPNLAAEPWTGRDTDARLDAAGRAFVNNPRGVRFLRNGAHVSRIYDWFVEDFGGNETGVLDHLIALAEPDLAARLRKDGRIAGQFYDWRLNDATGLRQVAALPPTD